MESLNEKAVYKLNVSCGRQGDLTVSGLAKAGLNSTKVKLKHK